MGRGLLDAGRATARGAKAVGRGARSVAESTARGTRRLGRATRRLTHAKGADRTGLGRLIELGAANSAADAVVAVALASTVFFGLPVGEARGSVALYLVVTMIPFALTAPFVGPILDRFRSGRRFVMAGTLFGRGLLCFAMAAAVASDDLLTLFASALGVLVLSKAYNVSRAAMMPAVLPADITLVSANARVALFSLVAAGVAVPVAAGLTAWLGVPWTLRLAMVIFIMTGVYTVRLPRHVDSPDADEEQGRPRWRTLLHMGPAVTESMLANVGIRFFSGFLLFFLLFLIQENHLPGLPPMQTIALLAAGAGAGGLLGAAVANWARNHSPQVIVLLTLFLALTITATTAIVFTLWSALVIALVAAFTQELGKLALDAVVQREIGEEIRSSTFGVVEAMLQLAWVVGGLAGLMMSLTQDGRAGLVTLAVVLGAGLVWLVVRRRTRIRRREARVRAAVSRAAAPETADPETAPPGTAAPGTTLETTKPLTNPQGP